MTYSVIGWAAGMMALAVTAAELVRMRAARGAARRAAGVEALMAGCMTAMALPVTDAWMSLRLIWVGLFAALGLACAAAGAGEAIRDGWRRGRHWFHHTMGCGAMACMTVAMASGAAHPGMAGMAGDHGTTGWDVACAVLAVYFLLSTASALRAQLLTADSRAVSLSCPDAAPAGRIAMSGIMAVMLLVTV